MQNYDANARQRAWSAYWSAGALHSCVDSFSGNYSGAIGDFWRDRFQHLRIEQRVLDLGTGNGALPKLLCEVTAGQAAPHVDAVDAAELHPQWWQPGPDANVLFHSGVQMESLPFADGVFDLVVSQFGLEYARWPEALDEALRVRKARGALAFVLHHADSVIVRVGREELLHQELLLREDGLLVAAEHVLPWLQRARAGDQSVLSESAAIEAKAAYNIAMQGLAARIATSPAPDLLLEVRDQVHGLLAGRHAPGSPDAATRITDMRSALVQSTLRTRELVGCALDDGKLKELAAYLGNAVPGLAVECGMLAQEEGILGCTVVARPA